MPDDQRCRRRSGSFPWTSGRNPERDSRNRRDPVPKGRPLDSRPYRMVGHRRTSTRRSQAGPHETASRQQPGERTDHEATGPDLPHLPHTSVPPASWRSRGLAPKGLASMRRKDRYHDEARTRIFRHRSQGPAASWESISSRKHGVWRSRYLRPSSSRSKLWQHWHRFACQPSPIRRRVGTPRLRPPVNDAGGFFLPGCLAA